jgi:SAM-dependent methyltransferase
MEKDYEMRIDFSDRNDAHARMIDMVGSGKRVVDFGCWTGFVARELKERGCYVTGIEIDPEAAEAARSVCDRVIVADLDTIDLSAALQGEEYDVGLFADVLEHLKEPSRLLVQMRDVLSSGGYIVASVPNIAHVSIRLMLLQGRFDYADTGILDDTHLKYYTRRSIGDLLETCGYIVDVMGWTEQRVSEEDLRAVLDPLKLANLEEVIEEFSTWEAVAFQYLIKACPASEEAQLQRLSEEKVQAERRVRVLERELEESERARADLKIANGHLESAKERLEKALEKAVGELEDSTEESRQYMRSLKDQIDKKDVYIRSLEAAVDERERSLQEKNRHMEALERSLKELESRVEQGQGRKRRRG